jgi:hypothetical protein
MAVPAAFLDNVRTERINRFRIETHKEVIVERKGCPRGPAF